MLSKLATPYMEFFTRFKNLRSSKPGGGGGVLWSKKDRDDRRKS